MYEPNFMKTLVRTILCNPAKIKQQENTENVAIYPKPSMQMIDYRVARRETVIEMVFDNGVEQEKTDGTSA